MYIEPDVFLVSIDDEDVVDSSDPRNIREFFAFATKEEADKFFEAGEHGGLNPRHGRIEWL